MSLDLGSAFWYRHESPNVVYLPKANVLIIGDTLTTPLDNQALTSSTQVSRLLIGPDSSMFLHLKNSRQVIQTHPITGRVIGTLQGALRFLDAKRKLRMMQRRARLLAVVCSANTPIGGLNADCMRMIGAYLW